MTQMLRPFGRLLASGIVLSALAVTGLDRQAVASTPSGASATLSPAEALAGFGGLDLAPIPAAGPAAVVSVTEAQRTATTLDDGLGPEISHQRMVVDAGPGLGPRTGWLLLFSGGDSSSVSWGPLGAGAPTVDFTGVIVDDQTGEVLRVLRVGHH